MNKIFVGNALDMAKKLEDNSINAIVTSPPYWSLRDYGEDTNTKIWGGSKSCEHKFNISQFCIYCNAWKGQLGLEPHYDLFIKHLVDIFEALRPKLKKDGSLWVNLGDTYSGLKTDGNTDSKNKNVNSIFKKSKTSIKSKSQIGIPERFKIAMIDNGWICRNTIIWHKPNVMPQSAKDRYTIDFEYFFFFTKNKKYYFKQQVEKVENDTQINKEKIKITNKTQKNYLTKKFNKKNIPYAIQDRDVEYIIYRNLPPLNDVVGYLKKAKQNTNLTIQNIEDHFGNSKGHHWFEKDNGSIPSKEEWLELKKLLNFDNTYDKAITTEFAKESKKQNTVLDGVAYRNKRSTWSINTKSFKESHFAVFPRELIKSPIDACVPKKNGVVLDPFFGSGTVGVEALWQDVNYIGFEVNPKYVEIAKKRLREETMKKNRSDKMKKQREMF